MNSSIVSFSTSEQAQIISTQHLRDDHVLLGDSILVDNKALAAVEMATHLESFSLEILPSATPFSAIAFDIFSIYFFVYNK